MSKFLISVKKKILVQILELSSNMNSTTATHGNTILVVFLVLYMICLSNKEELMMALDLLRL